MQIPTVLPRLVIPFLALLVSAQAPVALPNLTETQSAAVAAMSDSLKQPQDDLTAARAAMVAAAYAEPPNKTAIDAAAAAIERAELSLAQARASAFAKLQSSPAALDPAQVTALVARNGNLRPGQNAIPTHPGMGRRGVIPNIKQQQIDALLALTNQQMALNRRLTMDRAALNAASLTMPLDDSLLRSKAAAVKAAELALAEARAAAFNKLQQSANKLAPNQVAAFIGFGGSFAGTQFTQPDPLNFSAHEGYVSLFDGKTLKDWDGNPKFWRAEDGAIVGESTPQNPSGNSYLVYRGLQAKDFTLKFEIKVEGTGGSGFQYRSKTGVPWLSNIPDNVTANVGPVNLSWMMTGPQADFWPRSRDWTGQFYSENTPMRILAWRGQVVEGSGLSSKELMGEIGDRQALGTLVKMDDWNQYTVIARGGTLIQIVNGQLMAVMVDDDLESSNNQSGFFGIEIEATTKVSVRNIWLKKFN